MTDHRKLAEEIFEGDCWCPGASCQGWLEDGDCVTRREKVRLVTNLISQAEIRGRDEERARWTAMIQVAKSKVGQHFHTSTEHRGCGACINEDINRRLDNVIAALSRQET